MLWDPSGVACYQKSFLNYCLSTFDLTSFNFIKGRLSIVFLPCSTLTSCSPTSGRKCHYKGPGDWEVGSYYKEAGLCSGVHGRGDHNLLIQTHMETSVSETGWWQRPLQPREGCSPAPPWPAGLCGDGNVDVLPTS